EIPKTKVEEDEDLRDFYITHDNFKVYEVDLVDFENYYKRLNDNEKAIIEKDLNYYEVKVKNDGGLVMPVILKFDYADGTDEVIRIPAEIWKMGDDEVSKVFPREKDVVAVTLDPFLEIADTDRNDNYYPPRIVPTRFELFKGRSQYDSENPMQREKRNEQLKD
ncbi:MAG: M1 family peptidase, partial [Bacteroidia bacterium]